MIKHFFWFNPVRSKHEPAVVADLRDLRAGLKFLLSKFIWRQFEFSVLLIEFIANVNKQNIFLSNVIGCGVEVFASRGNSLLIRGNEAQSNILPLE